MYKNIVLIPALNPPDTLLEYVKGLIAGGFEYILLIDDGSAAKYRAIFDELEAYKEVWIYRHAVNMGKGRALKDGMNYVLNQWGNDSDVKGIITVDSDGQHSIEDVIKLQNELENQTQPTLLLGSRDFSSSNIPLKSSFGNKLTRGVFRVLYGVALSDTQTGLRGIPKAWLPLYLNMAGEGFEYEMNMLIYAAMHKQKVKECPIQTIYMDNNSETHFRPLVDSFRIYKTILGVFFRYLLSSLSASVIDLLLFELFVVLLGSVEEAIQIACATIGARVISSLYNFMVNKAGVFKSDGNAIHQAVRYYVLCVIQMAASALLVIGLNHLLGGEKVIEKAVVDTVLFFVSYQIQRVWVFKEKDTCTI